KGAGEVFNIGSGNAYSIKAIAQNLAEVMGKDHIEPGIIGKYRLGDIRHCFADISKAEKILGYKPQVSLKKGLTELAGWLEGRRANDKVDFAGKELEKRGLAV
ncbi:MAG: NAD-dependent epimerase/dehydratase family protein, partial [Prolixibacteraceae bacterium]